MTSALWLSVPVRLVYIDELVATQPHLHIAALTEDPRVPVGGDEYPHVVQWRGELYLEDGHHRAVRAMMRGERAIEVRLLDVATIRRNQWRTSRDKAA
jgi:hypothetical protein